MDVRDVPYGELAMPRDGRDFPFFLYTVLLVPYIYCTRTSTRSDLPFSDLLNVTISTVLVPRIMSR